MKKNNLLKFVIIGVVLCLFLVGSASAMSGSGTADDPYILTTAQDVLDISNNPSAYYELGNDISMSGLTNPQITTFSGSLDGKGFTISNVTNNTGGLFNQFNNVTLTNITFDNFTITQINNNVDTGTVVNKITGTSAFSNINVTNSSTINNYNGVVGGFVGRNESGISGVTVKNSYVSGSGMYVGGLIGSQGDNVYPEFSNCKVINCYIENTNVSDGYSAGLVGYLQTKWNGDSTYVLGRNCEVLGCYIISNYSGGLIGAEVGARSTNYGGTSQIVFDTFKVNNNLIKGNIQSSGVFGNGWNSGRPLSYPYDFTTRLLNFEVSNNSIYSDSGNSYLIAYRIAGGRGSGAGGGDTHGYLNILNSKFNDNLVYSNLGTSYYTASILSGIDNNFTIKNSNVYGANIQTLPDKVTLDNVVNNQGVYYASNPQMTAEQIDEFGLVHINLSGGFGTSLTVDTTNHTVDSDINFYDGTQTINDYSELQYEKTYPVGTYTANASFKFINPNTLSSTTQTTSKTFTVQKLAPEGSGTENDPYLITNAYQLQWMENHLTSYYKIMNTIDLTGVTWRQIDNFSGHIDGNNQTISNLTLNTLEGGLFNHAVNAEITDLTLSNFDITTTKTDTNSSSGILVGYVNGGIYTNLKIEDSKLNSSTRNTGGFIGYIHGANSITIEYNELNNCTIYNSTNSNEFIAGILGKCENVDLPLTISHCNVYDCFILGTNWKIAGITAVGSYKNTHSFTYNHVKNTVLISTATSGEVMIGGIIGYGGGSWSTVNSENNIVENCVIASNSTSNDWVCAGGIVGFGMSTWESNYFNSTNDSVLNCTIYSPSNGSGSQNAGGIVGRPYHYDGNNYSVINTITNATVSNTTVTGKWAGLVSGETTQRYNSPRINIVGGTFTDNNLSGTHTEDGLTGTVDKRSVTGDPSVEGTTTESNAQLLLKSLTPSVEGYTATLTAEVVGATVDYDTTDEVITTENLSYDFGDSTTPLTTDELEVEHTYTTRGTYTTTLSAQNYLTSQAVTLESDEYDVPVTATPTIEDESATPSTIIQRGTDTVTLSATITAPEGHEVTSIQWKQSDDNVTFTDISGATTATYVWTPTVGLHYVKVTATNADGSVDSNVLTVNVYGLATITKDDVSPLNVELGSKVTLDGAYTASSNPVPNTYSQWKYSSNGTTWNDLLGKNVNSGEYTCSTSGTFYVRYCVGDDDSGIFSFRNTYTVNVQQAEVITVTASKTEAALNENITLTAVIQHQYQETHKWQSSTDNVTFTDISGETGLTLDITTSTVGNMYYRLVSTNDFGTYTSNVVNIKTYGAPTVTANVVPLSVNVNDTVNLSGTVTVNPTMGDSDYTVKWQYSNNGGTTWTDIVGGSVLNTTTSFSNYGEYKVKLVVTDSYYTVNSDIFTVNVISVPTIESVNVTPLTTGTSGEFTLTSTVTAQTETYSVQWKYKASTATEWSNVTGGNVENCTLSGLSVGNYNIKLTASNEYGTVESQTFNVEVVAAPVVTASVDKQSVTVGDTIVFTFTITDTQTGGQADLEVSYDDGEHWNLLESDITSPYSYVVEVSNECIYRIAYSNSFYLVYSNEMPVSGHDLPVISTITLNPSDGKIGYGDSITAQTTVTSDLTTTKRWWYYNVNTPQTKVFLENSNVETYTYSNLSVGEYVIGIEVTDSLGNIVNGTCTTHVKVYGEPSVSLSVSPSSVSVGGSVTLTADVTVNPVMGDSDYSTYFQIKENNVWTNCTSPYTVLAEGTYEFRAVVTDSYFTEYSTSQFVQCANVPVVSGTADASTVSVGSTITLTGSVTSSLPVTSYKWQVKNGSNWNDLTTSPIYVSSYTLSEAGVYTFRFTASNSMGAGYSNEINVTAQEARSITASISSSSVQVGNSVDLSAVVTTPEYVAPIFSQSWEMSTDGGYNWDSMGISSLNTSYTPQTVGVYDFRYKIVDTFGVVSLSNVVSVTAGDIPVITLNVDSIAKVGDVKTFRADVTSLTPLTSTEWFVNDVSIGEGSGAEFAINYTFNEVGTYTVKFVAVNSIGSAYNTTTVTVLNTPVITDFALSFPTLEFGDSQTVHFKSNVSLDQLRVEQKYMTGVWTNTNAQISLIGDTYYGNWNVYTDGSHGGTVYTRVVAVNEVGTTYSDELSFNVNGKAPSSYAEVFKNADKNAQSVMIIAALVMLVIIGILFIGVITGTMDISTAVKAFLIVGGIVIVITFLVVFIGSMSGVITGLL